MLPMVQNTSYGSYHHNVTRTTVEQKYEAKSAQLHLVYINRLQVAACVILCMFKTSEIQLYQRQRATNDI
jgi:hypothetical protein